MPRSFYLEHCEDSIFTSVSSNPASVPASSSRAELRKRESMTNQELAQNNQRLQGRIQRLALAYQAAEQQNVMLRDRCVRLQNRVDELKMHLTTIKVSSQSFCMQFAAYKYNYL